MGGIKLSAVFKPQTDERNLVSLFNKRPEKKKPSGKQDSG